MATEPASVNDVIPVPDEATVNAASNGGPDTFAVPEQPTYNIREAIIDDISDSEDEDHSDCGLPYNDHNYLAKDPRRAKICDPSKFPIMKGLSETPGYNDDESSASLAPAHQDMRNTMETVTYRTSRTFPSHESPMSSHHPITSHQMPGPVQLGIQQHHQQGIARKMVPQGQHSFRPAKGNELNETGAGYGSPGAFRRSVPGGISTIAVPHSNVTAPKKLGRPKVAEFRDGPPHRKLLSAATYRAGMAPGGSASSAVGHQEEQLHRPSSQLVGSPSVHQQYHLTAGHPSHVQLVQGQNQQDVVQNVRQPAGAAPLLAPGRGQKPMARGRSAATTRRDMLEEGSILYPVQAGHQSPTAGPPLGAYRSTSAVSPRKPIGAFRQVHAPEDPHQREMMEAAANALAPLPMPGTGAVSVRHMAGPMADHVQAIRSPPQQHMQQRVLAAHQIVLPEHSGVLREMPGDLPRTPGRTALLSPTTVALMDRRTVSESQGGPEMFVAPPGSQQGSPQVSVHQFTGLPLTPRQRGRPRGSRSRSSLSSSTHSSVTSPVRVGGVQMQQQMVGGVSSPRRGVLSSPAQRPQTSGPSIPPSIPSTMASAAMAMSLNAPQPSQPPVGARQLVGSPPIVQTMSTPPTQPFFASPTGQAPLISSGGSTSYQPRNRRRKPSLSNQAGGDELDKEANEIARKILHGVGSPSAAAAATLTSPPAAQQHTPVIAAQQPLQPLHLSPREEPSDDDSMRQLLTASQAKRGRKHGNGRAPSLPASAVRRRESVGRPPIKKPLPPPPETSTDEDDEGVEGKDWIVSCICGQKTDDGEEMVACDSCKKPTRWQHLECLFPLTKKAPEGDFYCTFCVPRKTEWNEMQARKHQEAKRAEKESKMTKEKLMDRRKKREADQRHASTTHQKVSSQLSASATYKEIEKNEFSTAARRLLAMNRQGTVSGSSEILQKLKAEPRARKCVVVVEKFGLITTTPIDSGSYIIELIANVCLPREANLESVSVAPQYTFIFDGHSEDKILFDARRSGNAARFMRRSCQPNAELREFVVGSELHVMVVATEPMDAATEVLIAHDPDFAFSRTPVECACGRKGVCKVELHNRTLGNRRSVVQMSNGSRRSLPANGTAPTPKSRASPPHRAATTEKRTKATTVSAKKGKKVKGVFKVRRLERKLKSSEVVETSAAEETEEEMEEKKTRGRKKEEDIVKKEVKEEEKTPVTAVRSSARIRNDSSRTESAVQEVKKEEPMEEEKEERPKRAVKEQEKEKEEPKTPAKRGRRESKTEQEEEPESKKKRKDEEKEKRWSSKGKEVKQEMNYTLPAERNRPSRDDKFMRSMLLRIEQEEKKAKKETPGRGSTKKGKEKSEESTSTGRSGRGKRRSEMADHDAAAAKADTVTADASTPLAAPPRKRWAQRLEKELKQKEEESAPSSSVSSTPRDSSPQASPAPSGGKKKWLARHQEDVAKAAEAKAAEAEASAVSVKKEPHTPLTTPTRMKRNSRKDAAVEGLLGLSSFASVPSTSTIKSSPTKSPKKMSALRKELMVNVRHIAKNLTENEFGLDTISTIPGGPAPQPAAEVPPSPTKETAKPQPVSKKRLSLEEYRAKKERGGPPPSADKKKEDSEKKKESTPAKQSFIPKVDEATLGPSRLPSLPAPVTEGESTISIDDLHKRVYGDSATSKKPSAVVTPRPRTPEPQDPSSAPAAEHPPSGSGSGVAAGTRKWSSINERLHAEWGIKSQTPTKKVVPVVTDPPADEPRAQSPAQGQHTSRFSNRQRAAINPPGILESCPPPASIVTPTSTRSPMRMSSMRSAGRN